MIILFYSNLFQFPNFLKDSRPPSTSLATAALNSVGLILWASWTELVSLADSVPSRDYISGS